VFQRELQEALELADGVYVAEVARLDQLQPAERLDPELLISRIQKAGKPAWYLKNAEEITHSLLPQVGQNEVICVFSNGGFGGIHELLLSRLRAR
jgi:UDP-N-acetylmuramate: L-alanyl-gamma-D-glutamyl-meso-diaminopimelate ligase